MADPKNLTHGLSRTEMDSVRCTAFGIAEHTETEEVAMRRTRLTHAVGTAMALFVCAWFAAGCMVATPVPRTETVTEVKYVPIEQRVPVGRLRISDPALVQGLSSVTDDPGNEESPALSRDMRYLLYSRSGSEHLAPARIVRASIASPGNIIEVSTTTNDESFPSAFDRPTDGRRVLAVHHNSSGEGRVSFHSSATGAVAMPWLSSDGFIPNVYRAVIRPGSPTVVYETADYGVEVFQLPTRESVRLHGDRGIYEVVRDGTRASRKLADGIHPALSPDGRYLAYSKATGDRRVIMIRDLETHEDRRATSDFNADDRCPAWTIDGSAIIFSRRGDDGASDLFITSAFSEGNTRQLTEGESSDQLWPVCGLHGSVFFQTDHLGDWDIWRITINAQ